MCNFRGVILHDPYLYSPGLNKYLKNAILKKIVERLLQPVFGAPRYCCPAKFFLFFYIYFRAKTEI